MEMQDDEVESLQQNFDHSYNTSDVSIEGLGNMTEPLTSDSLVKKVVVINKKLTSPVDIRVRGKPEQTVTPHMEKPVGKELVYLTVKYPTVSNDEMPEEGDKVTLLDDSHGEYWFVQHTNTGVFGYVHRDRVVRMNDDGTEFLSPPFLTPATYNYGRKRKQLNTENPYHASSASGSRRGRPRKVKQTCEDPEGAHECEVCNKKYNRPAALAMHRRSHAVKSYNCPEPGCSESFTDKSTRSRHFFEIHKNYIHSCKKCGRLFAKKETQENHMQKCDGPQETN